MSNEREFEIFCKSKEKEIPALLDLNILDPNAHRKIMMQWFRLKFANDRLNKEVRDNRFEKVMLNQKLSELKQTIKHEGYCGLAIGFVIGMCITAFIVLVIT